MTIAQATRTTALESLDEEQKALATLIEGHWRWLNSKEGEVRLGQLGHLYPGSPKYLKLCLRRGVGHTKVSAVLPLLFSGVRLAVLSAPVNIRGLLTQFQGQPHIADLIVIDGWESMKLRNRRNQEEELLVTIARFRARMVVLLG